MHRHPDKLLPSACTSDSSASGQSQPLKNTVMTIIEQTIKYLCIIALSCMDDIGPIPRTVVHLGFHDISKTVTTITEPVIKKLYIIALGCMIDLINYYLRPVPRIEVHLMMHSIQKTVVNIVQLVMKNL